VSKRKEGPGSRKEWLVVSEFEAAVTTYATSKVCQCHL